jgi:hypothetical protein
MNPGWTDGERDVYARLEAMKAAVTAESAVWAVRDPGVTINALNRLDTALWTIRCMLNVADAAARLRAVRDAIAELGTLRTNTTTVRNAFRPERGADEERKTAVKSAYWKMCSDIDDLPFLLGRPE